MTKIASVGEIQHIKLSYHQPQGMLIKKFLKVIQGCQNNVLMILRLLKNLFFFKEKGFQTLKSVATLHVFKRDETNKGGGF